MLFADGALGLIVLVLWVFCIIDVICTDALLVRNLPKMVWLLIVLLLPDIGSIAWLVAGHPWQSTSTANLPYKGNYGRPQPARTRASNPDDDEEYLAGLRRRAEQQRRQADEQRRQAEQQRRQALEDE